MALPWNDPQTYVSADVSSGDQATIAHYNDLRADMMNSYGPPPPTFSIHEQTISGVSGSLNNIPMTWKDRYQMILFSSTTSFGYSNSGSGKDTEKRLTTTDWAAANNILGVCHVGAYIYVLLRDTTAPELRIYRYNDDDLTTVSQMTVTLGTESTARLYSDGTSLYVNANGGNTASNRHVFEEFSISGTTLTSQGATTCGATDGNFNNAMVDGLGNFYGMALTEIVVRHDSAGTLQATSTVAAGGSAAKLTLCIEGIPYVYDDAVDGDLVIFHRMPLLP